MVDIIFHYPFLGAMGDHSKKKPGTAMCVGCGSQIHDQFILRVSPDLEWHAACLKCAECSQYLDETCTCFVRDGKTYCKRDYVRWLRSFRGSCDWKRHIPERPLTPRSGLSPSSLALLELGRDRCGAVRPGSERKNENAQLSPRKANRWRGRRTIKRNKQNKTETKSGPGGLGRPEVGLRAGGWRPLANLWPHPVLADAGSGRQPALRPHVHKQTEKTTRVRTVLNEKQLHTLRTCYAANPRPDALMKEQLVEMTGLSPRVIRVWFQNKRCKDKKKSILMKQLQQQQHSDKTSLQGLTGTPLVAGSPIRHENAVQGSAVEVQTYQPPWKALSEFALQSDLDQPAFQQLVSFSESGSLGNSSGSDVTSLSSQLPDTPNSMVPSPVET
ncbi:PREDICTED: insulin gene enhancer protein ISL-2 [Mandrillus leucophaeus]|uniref:insulin gene enhancer protein ISL-2 n=1 Tax=Mandrillus leucophaeus TaxID=9568 RepID=UPI0005F3D673|nr:PREDICTED: insulin gene enhancer protein ISL-2 [Mandrillus leucophaeus]